MHSSQQILKDDIAGGRCSNPIMQPSEASNSLTNTNSVHIPQKTKDILIIKTKWLKLFRELMAVYSMNHT